MATGPCLCGDPYCGSCGNPTQAAYADACAEAEARLCAVLQQHHTTPEEYEWCQMVLPVLLQSMRREVEMTLAQREADKAQAEAEARMFEEIEAKEQPPHA